MLSTLFDQLLKLESAVSYKSLPPEGERPFTYQSGQLPILISAPHATAHQRKQFIKGEEEFTAAFAQHLAEMTGIHVLYSRYRSTDDPNWDRNSPYKRYLHETVRANDIRFVLDLHGMSNRHKIGLALGTINGRSCPDHEPLIIKTIQQHQFHQTTQANAKTFPTLRWDHFVLNHSRFTGGLANHTITRFASQKLGVPALQIELCSSARVVQRQPFGKWPTNFRGQPEAIQNMLGMLQSLVQALATAV